MPIIPTFLYATEYKRQDLSPASNQSQLVTQKPTEEAAFSAIISRFDNTTYVLRVSTTNPPEPASAVPPTSPSPDGAKGCTENNEFLEQENVRVGLMFASKAMVQLVVNPFVGPLTNR